MKVSVEAYTVVSKLGDIEAFKAIKKAGFDAVDYSYYWENENDRVLGDNYKEYALSLRSVLDDIGLECNQAHAPFSVGYGDKFDISEPKYLRLVRAMESAAILGAKNIVVHAITVPENVNFEEYNIGYYKSLIPYCKKFGICVAVENLFGYDAKRRRVTGILGSPKELNEIVEKLNSKYMVICVDVGHAALTGFEPQDFIRQIKPEKLKALHIQDSDYISDLHTLPYLGLLNWQAITESLRCAGYSGELTMEIFNFLGKFPNELIGDALRLAAAVGKRLTTAL